MDKIIKNALTGQTIEQRETMMRLGRRGKRRAGRSSRGMKLVLLPCLCDWNEQTIGRRGPYGR